jgi:hypothetical protein
MNSVNKDKPSISRREFVRDAGVGVAGATFAGSLGPLPAAAAETKYGHFIKKFVFHKGEGGPGKADYIFHMTTQDLEWRNTNFSFGYYSKVGAYNNEVHAHPYDSCLAFQGIHPDKPNYLGAEIEISLGKECEKYVFNSPTVVCVPKNLPHGPIVARKVDTPYVHYDIGLSGPYLYTSSPAPAESAETSSKGQYAHLIKKMELHSQTAMSKTMPGNADDIAWPRSKDLEGFIVNFTWGFYRGLGPWHPGSADPHIHMGDEFLCYVGLDPARPEYLGAVIDQYMGEDSRSGKQQEVFPIDFPGVAICPAGFPHAPAVTKKVDKTYAFFLIRRDTGERVSPNKTPDGYPIA